MATFFDTISRSFVAVTITANNEIETAEFLEASEALTKLFGTFYSLNGPKGLGLCIEVTRTHCFCHYSTVTIVCVAKTQWDQHSRLSSQIFKETSM